MTNLPLIAFLFAEETHGASTHSSPGLLADTSFWVSLGFVIVMGIFWKMGVHKTIAKSLDDRSAKISDELDEAHRLRKEAQELLAQYQRRQREAEDEAATIVDQAKKDAERLGREAQEKINDQLERRTKAAEEKIARAEAQALNEVRGQTTDLAVNAARSIIKDRMDSGAQSAMVEKAISDLRSKLN